MFFPIQRVHIGGKFPGVAQIRNSDLRWLVAWGGVCNLPSTSVQAKGWIQVAVLGTLQWIVESHSSLSAFTMDSWVWCWANYIYPAFQYQPWTVSFCMQRQPTTVVAKINGQHYRFLAVICLWINSSVFKTSVIMVWFCRGDWKTKVLLSLGTAQRWW